MAYELGIEEFPAFCGGRVITGFPYDSDKFHTVRKRTRIEDNACRNCEKYEDEKGSYWEPTSYCLSKGSLADGILDAEKQIRKGRAGVAFATVNFEQTNALKALRKAKYKLLYTFHNPNTGNEVYVLGKVLV